MGQLAAMTYDNIAADRRSRRLKKPPIEIGGWHSRSMLKQAGADA
jgi:hypothetical protein